MESPMISIIVVLFWAYQGFTHPTSNEGCGHGWVTLKHNCYFFSNTFVTWEAGQAECQRMKSNLVKIESHTENSLIVGFIQHSVYRNGDFWIGLNDRFNENSFSWISDNTPIYYQNWNPGEPNNFAFKQHCVQLWKKAHFRWDDDTCSNKKLYICEKPKTLYCK